jgi:hypothetical protein
MTLCTIDDILAEAGLARKTLSHATMQSLAALSVAAPADLTPKVTIEGGRQFRQPVVLAKHMHRGGRERLREKALTEKRPAQKALPQNIVAEYDRRIAAETDPLEMAIRQIRRAGFPVFRMSVVGGDSDKFHIGTIDNLTADEVFARAEKYRKEKS